MRNPLTRAIIFIIVGVICFTLSTLSKDVLIEKWSSFLFGFSFPMFLGGLVSLFMYYRKKRRDAKIDNEYDQSAQH